MTTFISQNWWLLFLACLLLFLLTSWWMEQVAKGFTLPGGNLRFSIFDLEFPVSEHSLDSLIALLTPETKARVRRHLLIDFVFMPAVYIGIALLCFKTGSKMSTFGQSVFWTLAVLQLLPWLFDALENGYLFGKLRSSGPVQSDPEKNSAGYRRFQFFVRAKFAVALTGAVCSLFGLLYFWLTGSYQAASLPYLGAVAALLLLFAFAGKKRKPVVAA